MKRLGSLKGRFEDERGISTVIVAISLIALFGAAMLSIDYGNTIQTRRNLITGTDATALEQARVEAKTPGAACQLGWTDYLARNVGTFLTTPAPTCIRHPDPAHPGTGWIEVQAYKESQTRLGGLFGIGNTRPWSLSAAQYGFATGVRGLRPMSFCNLNGHIQEWLDIVDLEPDGSTITPAEQLQYDLLRGLPPTDHPIYIGAGVVHRMFETKTWGGGGTCPGGGASGNWGWQDFNCENGVSGSCGNNNADLGEWIRDGWDGNVGVFPGPSSACDDTTDPFTNPGGCLNGTTGSRGNSLDNDLETLIESGIKFYVPIFQNVCCTGQSIHMQVYGFLGVRLWGIGSVKSDPYFDLEFLDILTTGTCCSKTPTGTNLKAVKLCDVDHDPDATSSNLAPNCS
jgi:hypothetical protein